MTDLDQVVECIAPPLADTFRCDKLLDADGVATPLEVVHTQTVDGCQQLRCNHTTIQLGAREE